MFLELLTEYLQRTGTRLALANSLTLCGSFEASRAELNAVIEHDPEDASARLALAFLTAREGDKKAGPIDCQFGARRQVAADDAANVPPAR